MSADTASKRLSAMLISLPFRGVGVIPSGTVDAGERSQAMFLYGLAAAAAATGTTSWIGGMPTDYAGPMTLERPTGTSLDYSGPLTLEKPTGTNLDYSGPYQLEKS